MINAISKLGTSKNNADEDKLKIIKRRLLYLYEVIVDITFVLKEIKDGMYYYNYSYIVDAELDNNDIKEWVDNLVLRKPWDITGNRMAIVL
ncbi:MAG: hypothetical protein HDT28_00790 [Clostridiales bacterium]|nr:hypothetical protein [Clostridiales bacterium]